MSAEQEQSHPGRATSHDADYIVVGSGAGGGTVAARLAESGFRVLLIEAGGDPRKTVGSTPQTPGINSLPDDYDVPAFHPLSAENDGIRWDFFVRHYEDQARQEQDLKYRTRIPRGSRSMAFSIRGQARSGGAPRTTR